MELCVRFCLWFYKRMTPTASKKIYNGSKASVSNAPQAELGSEVKIGLEYRDVQLNVPTKDTFVDSNLVKVC